MLFLFLAACTLETNNNDISKGMAKLVLAYFLSRNARISYKSALYLDAVHDSWVRIKSQPEVTKWVLRSYAKNEFIQDLVRDSFYFFNDQERQSSPSDSMYA